MDINLAKKADDLLKSLPNNNKQAFSATQIEALAIEKNISINDVAFLISIFIEDKVFEKVIHPNVPNHDFGFYLMSHKGLSFIHLRGGYTEQQKVENYTKTNVKFTWIRHWLWFYTSIISLLANTYFILKYLAKWL